MLPQYTVGLLLLCLKILAKRLHVINLHPRSPSVVQMSPSDTDQYEKGEESEKPRGQCIGSLRAHSAKHLIYMSLRTFFFFLIVVSTGNRLSLPHANSEPALTRELHGKRMQFGKRLEILLTFICSASRRPGCKQASTNESTTLAFSLTQATF